LCVTPAECFLSEELSSLSGEGVAFGSGDSPDRPIPTIDAREFTHSSGVVNAVADAAVEGGGTSVGYITGRPGVFSGNPYPYPAKPVPASTGTGFPFPRVWVTAGSTGMAGSRGVQVFLRVSNMNPSELWTIWETLCDINSIIFHCNNL